MSKSQWSSEVEIEIPFHDVDLMAIVWHGHYCKYLEIARCALLDSIDYNYPQMRASGFNWPVIDLQIRYINPAQFGQSIRVEAQLVEWEHRLKIQYLISDSLTGKRLSKAYTVQVAVNQQTQELCLLSPTVLWNKLGLDQP